MRADKKIISSLLSDQLRSIEGFARNRHRSKSSGLLKNFNEIRSNYGKYYKYVGRNNRMLLPSKKLLAIRHEFEAAYSSTYFEKQLRQARYYESRLCFYCGSNRNGQLDHYLPSLQFPQFYVFFPNLVPICTQCNPAKLAHLDTHHPIINGWTSVCFYNLSVKSFSNGSIAFDISVNSRVANRHRYKFRSFVKRLSIERKIKDDAESLWFEDVSDAISDEIYVRDVYGNVDFDQSIQKLGRHLEGLAKNFRMHSENAVRALLYRCLAKREDILEFVLRSRATNGHTDSGSYVARRYGVRRK